MALVSSGPSQDFPAGKRGCDDVLRRAAIGLERVQPRRWRFHQQLLIAPMVYPVQETADCTVRGFVSSNAGVGKELPRRPRGMLAEPCSDHVTPAESRGSCCGYRIDHGTGGVLGLRQRSRTVQHQNRIDLPSRINAASASA